MKKILLCILTIGLFTTAFAQKNNVYPVVVSFHSMCCGVPDNAPVMKLVSSFKKQYKIKRFTADKIGPSGREGEYELAFRLKELNRAQKIKFIQQLKKIVPGMTDKGSAEVQENVAIDKAALAPNAGITALSL